MLEFQQNRWFFRVFDGRHLLQQLVETGVTGRMQKRRHITDLSSLLCKSYLIDYQAQLMAYHT